MSDTLIGNVDQASQKKRSAQMFWARYFSFYDTLNESIPYRRLIERQVELLDPRPGELILDAGTGTGNVAVELLARGARVIGIDFCEPGLEKCRRKAPAGEFRFGDLTRPLEFPSDYFDKLSCSLVLYTFERHLQESAVREFWRVLKPGGMLVLTTFATGFSTGKVYLESVRELRRESNLGNTILRAARFSFTTLRIVFNVWKIKRRNKIGEYHFSSRDHLSRALEGAGFEVLSLESTFASQCLTAHARKPVAAV